MKRIICLLCIICLLPISITAIAAEDTKYPVKGISPEEILDVLADTEETFAAITAYYPVAAETLTYKANLYVENRSEQTLQYMSTICPEGYEGHKAVTDVELLPGKYANMALLFESGKSDQEDAIKELSITLDVSKTDDDTNKNILKQTFKVDPTGKETSEYWPELSYSSIAPRKLVNTDEFSIELWEVYYEDYDFNICLHMDNASEANKYTVILEDAYLNDCKCEPANPLFMELYAAESNTVSLKWDTKSLKYNSLNDIEKVDLQFLICNDNLGEEDVVDCTVDVNK